MLIVNGKISAVLVLHKLHDILLGQTKTELSLQVQQILKGKFFHVK